MNVEQDLCTDRNGGKPEKSNRQAKTKIGWYKTGDNSVIFVPATPGSELQRRYTKEIKAKGFQIKVVEKARRLLKETPAKIEPL